MQALTRVSGHSRLAGDIYELRLSWPEFPAEAEPGCFLEVLIPDGRYSLRRPISLHEFDREKGEVVLLYKTVGEGTTFLAERVRVGDKLDVFGPLGHGYPLPEKPAQHALLIGGGIGLPPLYELGKRLKAAGHRVTVLAGFRSQDQAFALDRFAELGEVLVSTEDGSLGRAGFVVNWLEEKLVESADLYYACGPLPLLRALETKLDGRLPGYLSFEERMACGIGACYGCVLDTKEGLRRVCADGPVFEAGEVIYGGI